MKRVRFFIVLTAVALAACMQTRRDVKPETPAQEVQPPVRQTAPPKKPTVKSRPAQLTETVQQTAVPVVPQAPGARIARVSVPGRYVALTFDDGPSAAYTPKVLDILRRHGAKATFFVLGENAVRNKGILARAAAEGHEIGSHTWSHIKLTGKGRDTIISEMNRTSEVVRQATGHLPSVMRPPYGATDKAVTSFMMQQYGMPSVLWDVDTVDWKHPGVGVVINRAVQGARNGSIILLHDIHGSTLAAVEGVVKGLQDRGFKLVTVSELIRLGRHAAGVPDSAEPRVANTPPPTDGGAEPEPAQPTQPGPPAPQPSEPQQPEPPAAPGAETGLATAPEEPVAPECAPMPESPENVDSTPSPQAVAKDPAEPQPPVASETPTNPDQLQPAAAQLEQPTL